MNTLFVHDGSPEGVQAARIMSGVAGMSSYIAYGAAASYERYGRIICIASLTADYTGMLLALRQQRKHALGLVLIGDLQEQLERARCQLQAASSAALSYAACIVSTRLVEDAIQAAEGLTAMDTPSSVQDPDVLQAMEQFLQAHNTCVLATASQGTVRSTPIEYIYYEGKICMFSEGGKKVANIYRHPQVSVSVFDPYSGFERLAGLQIDGTCRILEPADTAYAPIAAAKGLTAERLAAMPVILHILEITPAEGIFLWAGFVKQKKSVRQVYRFLSE